MDYGNKNRESMWWGILVVATQNEAAEWITRAIEQEKEAEKLIKDIRKYERVLLSILGRQIADLKSVRTQP